MKLSILYVDWWLLTFFKVFVNAGKVGMTVLFNSRLKVKTVKSEFRKKNGPNSKILQFSTVK
jgi:prolyl-tRNA editing enzyme YbaK/EbsC (Cys-tRNA(Pro) deacylase)